MLKREFVLGHFTQDIIYRDVRQYAIACGLYRDVFCQLTQLMQFGDIVDDCLWDFLPPPLLQTKTLAIMDGS